MGTRKKRKEKKRQTLIERDGKAAWDNFQTDLNNYKIRGFAPSTKEKCCPIAP